MEWGAEAGDQAAEGVAHADIMSSHMMKTFSLAAVKDVTSRGRTASSKSEVDPWQP